METAIIDARTQKYLGSVSVKAKNESERTGYIKLEIKGYSTKTGIYEVKTVDSDTVIRIRSASYAMLCRYKELLYFDKEQMLCYPDIYNPEDRISLLGRGSGGYVCLYTPENVVQKTYFEKNIGPEIIREWYMASLECECTPKALHMETYEDIGDCSMYSDYVGKTLDGELKESRTKELIRTDIENFMYQLIACIYKLSTYGIIHGDIKPQNIVVEYDKSDTYIKSVKLIDFGLACVDTSPLQILRKYSNVQTLQYRAPELADVVEFDNKATYPTYISFDNSIDIYSIGWIYIDIMQPAYKYKRSGKFNFPNKTLYSYNNIQIYFDNLKNINFNDPKIDFKTDEQERAILGCLSKDTQRTRHSELLKAFSPTERNVIERSATEEDFKNEPEAKLPLCEAVDSKVSNENVKYERAAIDAIVRCSLLPGKIYDPEYVSIVLDTIEMARYYSFEAEDFDKQNLTIWTAAFLQTILSIHKYDDVYGEQIETLSGYVYATIKKYTESDYKTVHHYFLKIFSLRSNIKRFDTPIVYLDKSLSKDNKILTFEELGASYNMLFNIYKNVYVNNSSSGLEESILSAKSQQEFEELYVEYYNRVKDM